MHILYSCHDVNSISRIKNITTTHTSPQTVSISGLGNYASHIRVSPYTTSSSTLFVGTEAGKLFKVTNADNSPSVTDITGSSFPTGSISCVDIGATENELVVTFFNYGVISVWYTSDGGTTWVSKEGNLPDMPVRWVLFNPDNRNEVLLATELGVWSTTTFGASSPSWLASNSGIANVRVDMLQYRSSDKQVIAATYGRGLFSCNGFATTSSTGVYFAASTIVPCLNETVTLSDTTGVTFASHTWSINPSTYTFVGGTTASSTNPQVQFTAPGRYTITLSATSGTATHTLTQNNYITAGGFLLPFTESWENPSTYQTWMVDNPDSGITWSIYSVSGNGSSTVAAGIDNFDYNTANGNTRDGLISPPIRLVGYSSATLSFKHAYRRYSNTESDSMAVYVSADCGTTWVRVASYHETQLASPYGWITNSNSTSAFTPTLASDWCGNTGYSPCKSINLSAYVGSVIKIRFENISGYGNNFYLDDISITGVSNMPAPVANFSASSTSLCSGNSATFSDLTTNNPSSWSWTFSPSTVTYLNGTNANSQNPVLLFANAGTYSVSLTAANTQSSSISTKSNYITVTQAVVPGILIATASNSICYGQSVTFDASITNGGTAPTYQWKVNGVYAGTNSSSFTSSTLNNNDTVTCMLTSNANCAGPLTVTSNKIAMTVETVHPSTPVITQTGTTLTCSLSGLQYQWYIQNISINNATSRTYTLTQSGVYKVNVTNAGGCSTMSADFNAIMPGIHELSGMSGFQLYPNPVKDLLHMQFSLSRNRSITVLLSDVAGRKVLEETRACNAGPNTLELNLGMMQSGVYQVQLKDGESVMVRQVVIE
jgi:PKD repeat protein